MVNQKRVSCEPSATSLPGTFFNRSMAVRGARPLCCSAATTILCVVVSARASSFLIVNLLVSSMDVVDLHHHLQCIGGVCGLSLKYPRARRGGGLTQLGGVVSIKYTKKLPFSALLIVGDYYVCGRCTF